MLDLTSYGRLAEFIKLTDKTIADASKDAHAEAARMLAIQVSNYQRKFGIMSFEEAVGLLESQSLDEEQAGWVADGLEMLALAIASAKDDKEPPATVQ